jgi:two-component system, chemotaxis family, sensor kinase CheA
MATEHQEFVARFMDEYFAECEEHLVEVRASLLTFESRLGSGDAPGAVLDDLFRSFHSLKGISAMADMREGERLAHELESFLRALKAGEARLSPEGLDALIAGTDAFERLVTARRSGQSPPSIEGPLERLAALAMPGGSATVASTDARPHASPDRRMRVTFTPSPTLVARGVKVDTIRERLRSIGEVEQAAPRVLEGGHIVFDFVVATGDEGALGRWRDDGLTFEPMPAEPDRSPAPEVAPARTTATFVRVDLARLDDLMRHVGDMVVTRSRLTDALDRIEGLVPPADWQQIADHGDRLERQLRSVREGVMGARLVPVGEVLRRMPLAVRDLARDTGKAVRVEMTGQDTEIDKLLVERMADPLLHLVRNAVSHGIEPPAERAAAGKPPEGTIRLSASAIGSAVLLDVRDDGRGLDSDAIMVRARGLGLAPADGDTPDLLDLICAPGFTTRDVADRASGRGIGMEVVRRTIRDLGGTLDVESVPGQGTTFRIALPLTLAITDALLLAVGDRTFAAPLGAVREVLEVDEATVTRLESNELLVHRGATLPIVRLQRTFALPAAPRPRRHAMVIGTGPGAFGLMVDRIEGQREIVVKAISDPLVRVGGVSGVTELGDGRVVLILDIPWLATHVRGRATNPPSGRNHR